MPRPIRSAAGDADELRHAVIDPQNAAGLVMHDDKVADGVEDFHPLRVRLGHPAEKARVVQRRRGILGNRLQAFVICPGQLAAAVGDQQQADQFSVRPFETNRRQILPAQAVGEGSSDKVAGRSVADRFPIAVCQSGEREIETSQRAITLRNRALMQINCLQALPAHQGQGGSRAAERLAGPAGNRLNQFGQAYAGADFHGQGHQGVGLTIRSLLAGSSWGEIGRTWLYIHAVHAPILCGLTCSR